MIFDTIIIGKFFAIGGFLYSILFIFIFNFKSLVTWKKLMVTLASTAIFSLSFITLWPSLKPFIILAFSNPDATSSLTLGIFTIITTLFITYLLYILSEFNSKREILEKNQYELIEKNILFDNIIDNFKVAEEVFHKNKIIINYMQSKMSAYFQIINQISEINNDHRKEMALKQIQSLMSRTSENNVLYELKEIDTLINSHPDVFIPIFNNTILYEYFINLKLVLKEKNSILSSVRKNDRKKIDDYLTCIINKIELNYN